MDYPLLSFRPKPESAEELETLAEERAVPKSVLAREVFELGLQALMEKRVLDLFFEGKLSFSAAAKAAHLSVWEFMEKVTATKRPYLSMSQAEVDESWERAKQMAKR